MAAASGSLPTRSEHGGAIFHVKKIQVLDQNYDFFPDVLKLQVNKIVL